MRTDNESRAGTRDQPSGPCPLQCPDSPGVPGCAFGFQAGAGKPRSSLAPQGEGTAPAGPAHSTSKPRAAQVLLVDGLGTELLPPSLEWASQAAALPLPRDGPCAQILRQRNPCL